MMIGKAKWQPLNKEAKSGFSFDCYVRGLLCEQQLHLRLCCLHVKQHNYSVGLKLNAFCAKFWKSVNFTQTKKCQKRGLPLSHFNFTLISYVFHRDNGTVITD